MVSMAIGLFLTWGAIQVYVQSKGNYRAAEVMTRLQENARFALETLEPALRLVGFWGLHRESTLMEAPVGITVSCAGADVSDWALDFDSPVAATDDDYDLDDLGCDPFSEAREDTDVLIVRHAGELLKGPDTSQIQIQSSLAHGVLFDDGVIPGGFGAGDETRDLVVDAYYVDNASSFSDAIPSLRRKTLVKGGTIEDQEMITGVENLQVQYGLDTNDDGTVERYVDPDSPTVTEGSPGFLPDATIVAVRVWILVRAEESPNPGFSDQREYQPLDLNAPPITPGGSLYPPEFPRIEVTKTIFLRNQVIG
jgi:hypothetical protein